MLVRWNLVGSHSLTIVRPPNSSLHAGSTGSGGSHSLTIVCPPSSSLHAGSTGSGGSHSLTIIHPPHSSLHAGSTGSGGSHSLTIVRPPSSSLHAGSTGSGGSHSLMIVRPPSSSLHAGSTGSGGSHSLTIVRPPSSSLHAGSTGSGGSHPFLLLCMLSSTLLSGPPGPAVKVGGFNKKSLQPFLRICTRYIDSSSIIDGKDRFYLFTLIVHVFSTMIIFCTLQVGVNGAYYSQKVYRNNSTLWLSLGRQSGPSQLRCPWVSDEPCWLSFGLDASAAAQRG